MASKTGCSTSSTTAIARGTNSSGRSPTISRSDSKPHSNGSSARTVSATAAVTGATPQGTMAAEATDDAVGYFIEDLEYHGRSERTREAYERVLRRFEEFIAGPRCPNERSLTPAEAGQRECMAWVHSLRESHSQSTVV